MTMKIYIIGGEIVKRLRTVAKDSARVIGGSQRLYEENVAVELENAFVELFQGDNPRFNKQRFLAACNGESIK